MIITNLLANMMVVSVLGEIHTNTPAFQEYAFDLMLSKAQEVSAKLNLDQTLVQKDKITSFKATPYLTGPGASMVFGDRYIFGTSRGDSLGFTDKSNSLSWIFGALPAVNLTNIEQIGIQARAIDEDLRTRTNHLKLKQARRIAESAMPIFGVKVVNFSGFRRPIKALQQKTKLDTDARVVRNEVGITIVYTRKDHPVEYTLPYYTFEWENRNPFAVCTIGVSGISSNVASFYYVGPYARLPKPGNYLEILGIRKNTVFVKERSYRKKTYETVEP